MGRNNYMAGGLDVEPKSSPPTGFIAGTAYLDDGTNTGSGNPGWRYLVSTGPDVWADVSGGGGGGAPGADSNLWTPPETPNALDEEFDAPKYFNIWNQTDGTAGTYDSGGIDVYDQTFNSGSVVRVAYSPDTRKSWFLYQPPSGKLFMITKPLSINPTSILMIGRLKFNQYSTGFASGDRTIGIGFFPNFYGRPAYENCLIMALNSPGSGVTYARKYRTVGGSEAEIVTTSDVAQQGQALEYVALHNRLGVYHAWVGTASGNWIHMGTLSAISSIGHVGIIVKNNGLTGPGVGVMGIDFLRFHESYSFEPDNFLY